MSKSVFGRRHDGLGGVQFSFPVLLPGIRFGLFLEFDLDCGTLDSRFLIIFFLLSYFFIYLFLISS